MKALLALMVACLPAFAWQHSAQDRHFETGYVRPLEGYDQSLYRVIDTPPVGTLPATFDVRSVVQIPDIKNQGGCGSCWAFGSTAAFEIAMRMAGISKDLLSEQELVSCDRDFFGCGGGDFAHGYQQMIGQSLASEFPYVGRNVRCKRGLSHQHKLASWGFASGVDGQSPTVDQVKAVILQYGASAVTVYADQNMMNYDGGVFDTCRNRGTNHIVTLIGWDDATGTWLMRNSWGKNWGEQGYMHIKYGCSNVAQDATFVVVK